MSYRHSSYRKMSRIVRKAVRTASGESAALPRHEMDRVLTWSNQAPLPKPAGWGKDASIQAGIRLMTPNRRAA